jgi:hypothetical protein
MCDWRASYENCLNLKYQGLAWRLPTDNELTALASVTSAYSIGKGNAGLMLCDYYDAYGSSGSSSRCSSYDACVGNIHYNTCVPHCIWTSTGYNYFCQNSICSIIAEFDVTGAIE